MKKILSFAVCVLMLFACLNVSAQNISVELDANKLEFDTPPVNISGRVLVPVRTIFEAMGATVLWNDTDKTVTSELNGTTVVLTINSKKMIVNGEERIIDVAARISKDRTLVPVRAIAEAFGTTVSWDAQSNTVNIYTQNFILNTEGMKTYSSSNTLSEENNVKSDFSISYFEDYDVCTDAADGTDFEIVSESDNHYALFSVRADEYTGSLPQMTDAYASDVASSLVEVLSGKLISSGISYINNQQFIKIHYTVWNGSDTTSSEKSDVLVYMGFKNGVVYTMTYSQKGEVPDNVSKDITYMMNTLIVR